MPPLTPADLKAIRGVVTDVLGGDRILMPKVASTEVDRYGNQGVVNAVWHATGAGKKAITLLVDASKGGDPKVIAAEINKVLGPELSKVVAAELNKLTLKSV